MIVNLNELKKEIVEASQIMLENNSIPHAFYNRFMSSPYLAKQLIEIIADLSESEEDYANYSATLCALEICVGQLHANAQSGNKNAEKHLRELMGVIVNEIYSTTFSLSFWLPVLSAFYEHNIELSEDLQNAYFDLANEGSMEIDEDDDYIQTVKDLLKDLTHLSDFDVIEFLFAQSYAMPADFFVNLLNDLYSIPEGREVALLLFLHPVAQVREEVINEFNNIISSLTLSSRSLTRLQEIQKFYPKHHSLFDSWIKQQRKKGVIFEAEKKFRSSCTFLATEIDGSGAQGIFIHYKKPNAHRVGGILVKQNYGIKDVWMTPILSDDEIAHYFNDVFAENLAVRKVDRSYFELMVNHFLSLNTHNFPNLHLLELKEFFRFDLHPKSLSFDIIDQLAIQIMPFTPEKLRESLNYSKKWMTKKDYTKDWFMESPDIDKIVNKYCNIINGVKVCNFVKAEDHLFAEFLEIHRDYWIFHFLWVTLWLKAKARKNERTWIDSLYITYAIYQGIDLVEIPIMREICHQTVVHSIETMHERKTHLA